jgi:hypothetical protein
MLRAAAVIVVVAAADAPGAALPTVIQSFQVRRL